MPLPGTPITSHRPAPGVTGPPERWLASLGRRGLGARRRGLHQCSWHFHPVNDKSETAAIKRVFEEAAYKIPVAPPSL